MFNTTPTELSIAPPTIDPFMWDPNPWVPLMLHYVIPYVNDWWDTYSEQRSIEESAIFVVFHTWYSFRDAIKEQYYPVGSYEDQFTRWNTLCQEMNQTIPYFTNIFHTLCTKLGNKDSERHLVLKYCGCFHRYIQTKMDFLDIA